MQEATGTDAVSDVARQVLDGTGWELARVRRRFSRLEPPHSYWVVHEITVKKDEEEDKFRLVARGAFDAESWSHLKKRLEREGGGRPCDPIYHMDTRTLSRSTSSLTGSIRSTSHCRGCRGRRTQKPCG